MAHSGILSKGLVLGYAEIPSSGSPSTYTDLTDLQEIPDLGANKESVEVTTLADAAHMYINGLIDYGDSLDFTFLYNPTQFATLEAFTGAKAWRVGIPDGTDGAVDTTCAFEGECSVRLNGIGVGEALTYTLSIKPSSMMVFA